MRFLFRRARELADQIEALVQVDLDLAAERYAENRRRLRRGDAERLAAQIRAAEDARDNRQFLSKSLAERTIQPTPAFELLETYRDAGYVSAETWHMLRRHIVESHRQEIGDLLADPKSDRFDYFRKLDEYRSAGYLTEDELARLEELVDGKLNPGKASSRLYGRAVAELDVEEQERLLHRYLVEFEGYPDYADAASLYLSVRIDRLWKRLPTIRSARVATLAVNDLNTMLRAYLAYTADIGETVPINRIVNDFMKQAGDFHPDPDDTTTITEQHHRKTVVVVEKWDAEPRTYRHERNTFVELGAVGRVKAVAGEQVAVTFRGRQFAHTRTWPQPAFEGTEVEGIGRNSDVAVWHTEELGLRLNRTPSPVRVHQYKQAVHKMDELLREHREDHSPEAEGSPEKLEVELS